MSKRRLTPATPPEAHTADEIYQKIYVAVLEHRLRPGTKLVEGRLATIFGCSRTRVREALARLAHELVVEQIAQKGAFIAQPSIEQARNVFEMRRVLEPAIIQRLIQTLNPEKIRRLREHQHLEIDARQRADKPSIIRLTGEFHQLLAELAGSDVMARSMRQLSVLTCLIIFLYDAPMTTSCRADEHSNIIDAVEAGDVAQAQTLVLKHLGHIEASLRLEETIEEVDLESIFDL